MAQNPGIRASRNRIVVFLIAVTILSAGASVLDTHGVFGHAGSLAYMWCPGLAALIASLLTARSLRTIGWTTRLKWLPVGWLIPIAYATVGYAMVWISGLGGVPSGTFISRARLTLNMPSQPPSLVIAAAFGFISFALLLPSMISGLGEEIGWRGFLFPELAASLGLRAACLVTGVIWTLWHVPAFLHGYGTEGTPKAYQIACFSAMVMCSAVVMGWLRVRSGSIWPCVIVHATHNAAIQLFFDHITAPRAHTAWFIGEFGCAMLIPLIAMAWYCMRDLRSIEAPANTPVALPRDSAWLARAD